MQQTLLTTWSSVCTGTWKKHVLTLFLGSANTSPLFQTPRCKHCFFVCNQMRIHGFQFLQRKRLLCSCLPEKPFMHAILKTDNFQACSITRKRADVNTTVVWYFNWRHAKLSSKGSVSNTNNRKLAEKCCTSKNLLTWKILEKSQIW